MKIKNRLSLYFTAVSALVLLIVQIVICITFSSLIRSDFYAHLMDRANIAAKLYLKADELSADSLSHVREYYLQSLPSEVIRFYDEKNLASFIKDKNQLWPESVISKVRKNKHIEFKLGETQTVGLAYNDNQGNFVIMVSAVNKQGTKRLFDLVESMAILWLCVTAGLFIISRWFAQKALEPIDSVIRQMRLVRAGNLSLRVDEGAGKDEISALAHNFNQLLEHLESAFELQQTFVMNASHELRTPPTSIIGEIEIALRKLRTNNEYAATMESVLSDAVRLNVTITSLLELAQVEMNYTQPSLKPVAIDELIWELNDFWTEKKGKGHFNVFISNLPDDPEKLQIPGNKSLLSIALNNIIGNAFKFSDNETVKCELYADDQRITITITDQGIGILPAELEKFSTHFTEAQMCRVTRAMVSAYTQQSKIISLLNGKIAVSSGPGKGTAFAIEFTL